LDIVSPELALVDAELAASARRRLPDPGDCLARAPAPAPPPLPVVDARPYLPAGSRPSALVVVATLLVAAIVGSPVVDLLPSSGGAQPTLEATAPDGGAVEGKAAPTVEAARSARVLRWRAVGRAAFYNVTVWRDGAEVLNVWPTANRVTLVQAPTGPQSLPPGRYSWFVYPAFDVGDEQTRFGKVIASGVFRLAPASAAELSGIG
jgi:hypothetical protein